MKFLLPPNTFSLVTLSPDHQQQILHEANTIVKEIIHANDAFTSNNATLSRQDWRLLRVKEGVHVYRQRKQATLQCTSPIFYPMVQSPSNQHVFSKYCTTSSSFSSINAKVNTKTSSSTSSSLEYQRDTIMERMRSPHVPLMALHGSVDGTLDDCMYGCVAATDVAWMLRSSHIHDGLDDARILATFQRPNRIDPCRFLNLKWFAKEHPVLLTGIVQQRDFVIVEFSGFSLNATGERVGFMLMRSVAMHEVPELSHLGIVRGVMSFCYIFRQHGPGRINIVCRGFFDSGGEMPARLSVALAADSAVCCANLVDYAHIKKLRWLMQHASQQQSVDLATSMPPHCEACEKSFRKFSFTASGSGLMCNICRHVICSKCSVVKKMTVHASDTGKIQQCALPFFFCLACLCKARQKSGWDLAIDALSVSLNSLGLS